MAHIQMIEFITREGLTCLQRADDISTILETTHTPRGGAKQTVMYLLLRNNNRIEVVGETRESIFQKLQSASGTLPTVIQRHEGILEEAAA
jgi:hypothetical protein